MARHRSCPIHQSFNTSLQHTHSISPLLPFPNMSESCIPTCPCFAIHNTSSAHVYQEHRFPDPSIACDTNHQLLLYDSTYPSQEIALAPVEQCSNGNQPIESGSFSRTAGQGYQYDALSLDTTFDHSYLTTDDNSEMTHPTSPPFSLDSFDSTRPPWICQHPEPRNRPPYPLRAVPFPLTDLFPGSSSLTAQEETVGVSHLPQLNAQESEQLNSFGDTAGLSRLSHHIPTHLPPRPYSADPPRTGVLGKRIQD
ncbi:uncharacterized protein EDB93DRAFT_610622 [Suillus bovinus]|uniref:uncharacterized protein n=1 Tax=Suillus bovinus TaxID=48563 RepID=UPI001B8837C7|nr:uncharacterized protein EDB93DRAFT_610622 [Suillus bovinus]KAG2142262.1 hypothetical protein EDB93DRAFT_610622 [Suillus bovinus]